MAEPQETMIDCRGCRVRLRRAGTGAPLLYLHGANGFLEWLPFFDRLSDQFEVIAPDHPSFGRSTTPDWLDDIGDMAYFYLDLIDALHLDGVHLVGHSMGGWLALEMAIRSTARIKTLTLINSAGIRIKGKPIADILVMDREESCAPAVADPQAGGGAACPDIDAADARADRREPRGGGAPCLAAALLQSASAQMAASRHGADPDRVGRQDGIIAPDYAAAFRRSFPARRSTWSRAPRIRRISRGRTACCDDLRLWRRMTRFGRARTPRVKP